MNEILLKNYVASNDIFGYPQSYRGIDFYPIKVKDVKFISSFYNIFTYPKHHIVDKKILKMSYLKFVIGQSSNPQKMTNDIQEFLEHITHKEVAVLNNSSPSNFNFDSIAFKIIIDGIEFSENDFDDIREIILEQNGSSIEYVNEYHPELEQILLKIHSSSDITFQDEIFTISVLMKKHVSEIGEYTLFQLQNIMERMVVLKQFDLYQPLVVSGQITLKNDGEIKPYLYHLGKRGRYDEIKTTPQKVVERSQGLFSNQI